MSPLTVAVGPSPLGSGVFATRAFQPGQPILVVSGPILNEAGVAALGADAVYALQTARNEYVDLSSPGRFLNHSCDPNAGVVRDRVLIALRSIAEGEEIRFDYSTAMGGDRWSFSCRCGEPFCRRVDPRLSRPPAHRSESLPAARGRAALHPGRDPPPGPRPPGAPAPPGLPASQLLKVSQASGRPVSKPRRNHC